MELAQFRIDDDLAVGSEGIVAIVFSMVILGCVKRAERNHLGYNAFPAGSEPFSCSINDSAARFLIVGRIEDGRTVLGPDVRSPAGSTRSDGVAKNTASKSLYEMRAGSYSTRVTSACPVFPVQTCS